MVVHATVEYTFVVGEIGDPTVEEKKSFEKTHLDADVLKNAANADDARIRNVKYFND